MNRDDFFMTGESWAKFHSSHPSIKLRSYEKCNAAVKAFFIEFESEQVRCGNILADHALCREIRRIWNSSSVPYTPPEGLKEPKPEPMENESASLEFMYHFESDCKEETI
jgi:hypothetical protein